MERLLVATLAVAPLLVASLALDLLRAASVPRDQPKELEVPRFLYGAHLPHNQHHFRRSLTVMITCKWQCLIISMWKL